jgi:hypothetical protein
MCCIPHSLREFLYPCFPPLDKRAQRWIDSELGRREADLAEFFAEAIDEEQKPC